MEEKKIKVERYFVSKLDGTLTKYTQDAVLGNIVFAFQFQKELPFELVIGAVHCGIYREVKLRRLPNHFYVAETGCGRFYFVADNVSDSFLPTENGKRIKFSELTPVNEDFFDKACRDCEFFFVGD